MPCALGTLRVGWHRELCVQVRHGFDLVLPLLSGGGGSSSVSALSVLVCCTSQVLVYCIFWSDESVRA
jgi:hypothetical protein